MKITIESNSQKVSIETPIDEMNLPDLVEDLIKPALLAMQYHPDCVGRITYEEGGE